MKKVLSAALVCGLVALSGCKTATGESARYPNVTASGGVGDEQISAKIYRPEGAGPFPTVILLHGCNGPGAHMQWWADKITSWGYAAAVVDSFGPRGQGDLCQDTHRVGPYKRVFDVFGTVEFLKTQPFVKADSIGLIGFSHGGWTIMKTVQRGFNPSKYNIKAAVAFYPYCTPGRDDDVALPLMVLMGDSDDWTPPANCQKLQTSLKTPTLVDMVFLKGAYHAFDYPYPPGGYVVQGVGEGGKITSRRVQYDAKAAAEADARTKAFFERHLK
ncbi:MAG: dienelactone hydrolase family protein [Alphaproteobacteria bacterium]|nr:dienelactone hydrolase family protein [Alphaproteobacteria bacterium]